MDSTSPADIATHWISKWAAEGGPSGESDGNDLDWDLPRKDPRLCLDSILQVLGRIPTNPENKHFQVLAAGPLEDLLVHHGITFVDEIEILARRSPAFRALLNGIWTSRVNPQVVTQLSKYRSTQW